MPHPTSTGSISKSAVATAESQYDIKAIRRLVRANKQGQGVASPYPVSDMIETYNVEETELVFTTTSRSRAAFAHLPHVKSSFNGEGYEAARKLAAMPVAQRDRMVRASVSKNSRYFGVAMTSAQANESGFEDKVTVQVVGTATVTRGRSAPREIMAGDRLVGRVPLPGAAGLPSASGDDQAGVPTNKYTMEVHPMTSASVTDELLAHARAAAYDPALYRAVMGDDSTTDALHTATGDLFAFIRLCAVAGVRELLRNGELELSGTAKARAAAAGSDEMALIADASASNEAKADAATVVIAELLGATRSRTYTPDVETRKMYGLAASKIIDTVLYDGSNMTDEIGFERQRNGTSVFRARYTSSPAINKSSPYGAFATAQALSAARALQAVAALHLESSKNYIGKALSSSSRDMQRVDVVLGAH